jgi:transposase
LDVDVWEVLDELVGHKEARTYKKVAEILDLHVGTVYTHLKRVRDNQPGIYNRAFSIRKSQLEILHQKALARADAKSHEYHRNMKKQWNNLVKLAGVSHLIPRGGMTRKEQINHFNSLR